MGMSIDKAIEHGKEQLEIFGGEHKEFIETALDTMRKYQKIQDIVRWNNAPSPYYKPDGQLFREICEVLEDGNES